MSDEILQGPFPAVTDHQVESVMPVGQPGQRAVYLRLDVLDDERSATFEFSLTRQRARRIANEILARLE